MSLEIPPNTPEPISEKEPIPQRQNRLLRNIIIVNFFYRIFGASFMFMLPLFAVAKGWTDSYYGLVLAIGGYVAMGVAFFLGMIVDVRFKRTTMIIGLFAIIISAVLFSRFHIRALSIIFYCLYAVGQQLMMLSTNTFIANETEKGDKRTKGFSGNAFFTGVARIIAPLACGYLLLVLDFDWVFLIMGVFGLISLILVFVLRLSVDETPSDELAHANDLSVNSGDDYSAFNHEDKKEKHSVLGVQISFGFGRVLMGFTSGVAIPFVSWYILTAFDPTTDLWGWITSISNILLTLGYVFMAFMAEKIGKDIIVVISWALVVPAAVGIMFAQSFFWAAFFFIIRNFFARIPMAPWNSFLFEWIPPKNRGKTLGLLQTAQRGARASGTLLGGLSFALLGATLFPIAMTAYPIAGLLPMIQSKIVKKRFKDSFEKDKRKMENEEPPIQETYPSIEVVGGKVK
ncbi:MAG: MFS transporter [Candidatus Heimdallarchaeota archaeon]|nr:MFS transporter [Candidatus Heimdallarchaeota archaeon]